jgi:hypothetical protein
MCLQEKAVETTKQKREKRKKKLHMPKPEEQEGGSTQHL